MNKTSAAVGSLPKQTLLYRSGKVFIKMGRALYKRTTIVEIICALHIILFIYTGVNKMMDYEKFKLEISRSPFIEHMSEFIAPTLPIGEILLSLTLIWNRTRTIGLYLSFSLMTLFTGYIWLMLNYAYDLPCSCGGIISKLSWHEHLIFNSLFTILSLTGIILQSKIQNQRLV